MDCIDVTVNLTFQAASSYTVACSYAAGHCNVCGEIHSYLYVLHSLLYVLLSRKEDYSTLFYYFLVIS